MNRAEAEIAMSHYRHLICKMFEHKDTKAQMKLTFMQVDKDVDSGNYKVSCFADGTYGHIIEDLDNFLVEYSPIQSGYYQ